MSSITLRSSRSPRSFSSDNLATGQAQLRSSGGSPRQPDDTRRFYQSPAVIGGVLLFALVATAAATVLFVALQTGGGSALPQGQRNEFKRDTVAQDGSCSVSGNAAATEQAHYAILGAGPAGLVTAYRLVKTLNVPGSSIIMLEAQPQTGGRVDDITDPANPNFRFGNGPQRVGEAQVSMRCLAKELAIDLEYANGSLSALQIRGQMYGPSTDAADLAAVAFAPGVSSPNPSSPIGYWYARFLNYYSDNWSPDPNAPWQHPRDYANSVEMAKASMADPNYFNGLEDGFEFMKETDGFRSDWSDWDAQYFHDLYTDGATDCCNNFYVKGGFSRFTVLMTQYLQNQGVRIHTGDPVTCWSGSNNQYVVSTAAGRTVQASFVINAIPPTEFVNSVYGNAAARIKAAPQFQAIKTVAAATAATWWPYNWWESLRLGTTNMLIIDSSTECFNMIEFPVTPYLYQQNATRSVYDDGNCMDMWRDFIRTGNYTLLQKTIVDGLRRALKPAFPNIHIPEPLFTKLDIHDPAWHVVVPQQPTVTACDIMNWAANPLPNENICNVGEGYNPIRSSWTDAAVRSSLLCLKQHLHLNPLPFLSCTTCGSNEHGTAPDKLHYVDIHTTAAVCGNKCSAPSSDFCQNLYPANQPDYCYSDFGYDPSCGSQTMCATIGGYCCGSKRSGQSSINPKPARHTPGLTEWGPTRGNGMSFRSRP